MRISTRCICVVCVALPAEATKLLQGLKISRAFGAVMIQKGPQGKATVTIWEIEHYQKTLTRDIHSNLSKECNNSNAVIVYLQHHGCPHVQS